MPTEREYTETNKMKFELIYWLKAVVIIQTIAK